MLTIDVGEFLRNPVRTGIQRAVRELLTQWPDDVPKTVACFDPRTGQLRRVDSETIDHCIGEASNPYFDVSGAANPFPEFVDATLGDAIALERGDRVLVPELFSALARVDFYRQALDRGVDVLPIVYDLLLWTSPNAWNISYVGGLNDYLELIGRCRQRAFNSHAVRAQYYERFRRSAVMDDPIIALGSDALARLEAQPSARPPYMLCVGSFDGKKRQDVVYDAFLASHVTNELDMVFAGKVPSKPRSDLQRLFANDHPGVTIVDDPTDRDLASLVLGARCSVFISALEGFGLPAVESLYVQTPVIARRDLPALANLASLGQLRIQDSTPAEVAAAMNILGHGSRAAELRIEAKQLRLPTWRDYAETVAAWARA